MASPVLDTIGAAAGVAAIATGIAVASTGSIGLIAPGNERPLWIGVPVALAGVVLTPIFTVSAVEGYSWTAGCRELKEAQLSCVSGVEESCQSLRQRGR